jgi:dTDP-4-dehydrorhamnose 3,5-epimerase
MKISPLRLKGAFVIEADRYEDERGFFARLWDAAEFQEKGIETTFSQVSLSFNAQKGTLRGLHFQQEPHPEAKLVRCIRGAIHDVIVDIRPDSDTYLQWEAVELSAENLKSLYIPVGMAHGFQTLCENAEVLYMISTAYHAHLQRGLRYDDPALGIAWPLPVSCISQRDRQWDFLAQTPLGAVPG